MKSIAESCSRQLRGWADSLQNSEIKGQRHLNDQSRRHYDAAKTAEEFQQELLERLTMGQRGCDMGMLKRNNRFYDTVRFGQPQIRVYHRKSRGKQSPRYLLKCGCCDEKVEIFYSEDGLEINGVNGSIEDWREILLPLLEVERSERQRQVCKR